MTIGCLGLVAAARAVLPAGHGLSGQYFANAEWTGPPAFSAVDDELSTAQLTRRWNDAPPAAFSVRWIGYLTLGQSGTYRFATTSDDGSQLYVDNRLVVNNGGMHGPATQAGSVPLEAGSHRITLDYVQSGGSYALDWSWSPDGGQWTPVPGWALSQRRVRYRTVLALRALDWLWWAAATLAVLFALWWIVPELAARALTKTPACPEVDARPWTSGDRQRFACLGLFIGLAVLETWPLATNPVRLSRNDNGDTILNEWIMAWVVHQAPRDPLHLFQANIFYPEPNSLALSEALLVQSAFAAPLLWAGASPVLAYNVVLLAGLALTGWAMCLVVARWTHDWAAGIAAGILVGFSSAALTRLPHMQAQHVEFLPFTLLALDALLREPRLRHTISLAIWFTLQALTSYYLFVITTMGLAAATIARPESWWGRRGIDCAKYLAVAGGLAAILLLPSLWPYWRIYHDQGLTRRLQEVLPTYWQDYVTTPARFDHWLMERWSSASGLFPGFIGLLLAGIAIARGALKDPRPRMCLTLGVCGVVLSFGTSVPGYALLYHIFPPLHGIRAPSRFGYLATVAVAVIAGYGVADLRRRARRPWQTAIVIVVIPIVLTLESLAIPIHYRRAPDVPAIYRELAGDPGAVVAELPLPNTRAAFLNAPYMLNSTVSWYRLLNGYSGFLPASYVTHYDGLSSFPSAASVAALQRYGVTHIFVHLNQLSPAAGGELQRTPALRRVAEEGAIALYRVVPVSELH